MAYDPTKNIHAGHRERLRGTFAEHGADSLRTHQLLELLLFYAIPYKDTNPIAHALLTRFGSLREIFAAPISELESVEGVGRNAAVMLKLVFDSAMEYLEIGSDRPSFNTTRAIGLYLSEFYRGADTEFVSLMLLDNSNSLITCKRVFDGDVSSSALHVSELVGIAIRAGASSVVIAHNHPGGLAIPSSDDLHTTRELARAFAVSGMLLIDHVIIAGDDFSSTIKSHPASFITASKKPLSSSRISEEEADS